MCYGRTTYPDCRVIIAVSEGGHAQEMDAVPVVGPRRPINSFKLLIDCLEWNAEGKMSRDSFDKLFAIITEHFGDQLGNFPTNFKAAWKRLEAFDAPWHRVDLCVNGCVFFEKDYATADECPKCKEPRWEALGETGDVDAGKGKKPRSTFFWWNVVDLLRRVYANPHTAEMMLAHSRHVPPEDGSMRTIWDEYSIDVDVRMPLVS